MAAAADPHGKSRSHIVHRHHPLPLPMLNQRVLGFSGADREGEAINGDRRPTATVGGRRSLPSGDVDDDVGLEELREKLMGHLREAADRMKLTVKMPPPPPPPALPPHSPLGEEEEEVPPPAPAELEEDPWNLRTRRAASKTPPIGTGRRGPSLPTAVWAKVPVAMPPPPRPRLRGGGEAAEVSPPVPSPEPSTQPESSALPAEVARSWNLRKRMRRLRRSHPSPLHSSPPAPAPAERLALERTVRLRSASTERRENRPKFSVSLTREEIEEDVYAFTGSRPRRRPKKRPRAVQRQLDLLFPGSWLSDITADLYKVPDD